MKSNKPFILLILLTFSLNNSLFAKNPDLPIDNADPYLQLIVEQAGDLEEKFVSLLIRSSGRLQYLTGNRQNLVYPQRVHLAARVQSVIG